MIAITAKKPFNPFEIFIILLHNLQYIHTVKHCEKLVENHPCMILICTATECGQS